VEKRDQPALRWQGGHARRRKKVLANYLAWEADEGKVTTCCILATPEEIEADPEAFDCETCPRRIAESQLSPHDHLALRVYGLLQTSAVRDLGLTPLVFDVLQLRCSQFEGLALLEKLDVIHQHSLTQAKEDAPTRAEED
jgi:hypothetical protein